MPEKWGYGVGKRGERECWERWRNCREVPAKSGLGVTIKGSRAIVSGGRRIYNVCVCDDR